jgi:hypothetical protein
MEIWKNIPFFFPLLNFYMFSVTSRNKTRPGGQYYIVLLKLISKKLSRKEGKGMARGKNRDTGEKH